MKFIKSIFCRHKKTNIIESRKVGEYIDKILVVMQYTTKKCESCGKVIKEKRIATEPPI